MCKEKLMLSRGEVVGIGKLKIFPSSNCPHEIPMLSFMVIKTPVTYVSVCVQLLIEGNGETPEKARESMKISCLSFLETNFTHKDCKENGWENLKELFKSSDLNNELWNDYREIQLILAEEGVCTDISEVFSNHIKELKKQIIDLKKEIKEIKEDYSFVGKIVQYKENLVA